MSEHKCYRCGEEAQVWFEENGEQLWVCPDCLSEPKRSKFNNTKVKKDGYTFDSILESERYDYLRMLEEAGVIKNLRVHVSYIILPKKGIQRAWRHIVDFEYVDNDVVFVEDTKGFETQLWQLKHRLFTDRYPEIKYLVVKQEDMIS